MSQNENEKRGAEPKMTDAQQRSRRARNVALAVAIGLFMALIYVVTLVKLGTAAHLPSPGNH
jgi:hypothetical protein